MSPNPAPEIDAAAARRLSAIGDGAPGPEEKLQWLGQCRHDTPELNETLDRILLGDVYRYHGGLIRARDAQAELKALLDRLTAPPWQPAVFLGAARTPDGDAALVAHGSMRRVVQLNGGVSVEKLSIGDEVFLTKDLNALVGRSESNILRVGDVAAFERHTSDGRLVLNVHDEETIVDAAARLASAGLKSGDLVRWDRATGMAFEVVERSSGSDIFLEDMPSETFADIGGLDAQIEELQRAVLMRFRHGALVARYGLKPKRSVLLWGPPGTGKTMLARALANQLATLSPSGRARFASIKPGSLNSMWFGQSERNYREVFRAARTAGERDPDVPVCLYFDEVDAIGAARSHAGTQGRRPRAYGIHGGAGRPRSARQRDGGGLHQPARRARPGLTRPGRLGRLRDPRAARPAARRPAPSSPSTCGRTSHTRSNGHGADLASHSRGDPGRGRRRVCSRPTARATSRC